MCQWSNGNNLEHLMVNQLRQRRRHFDKLMLNNPTLSREEAALQIKLYNKYSGRALYSN
jgi:hypothetical protein